MKELLQTINRSLLEMVGRGIELLPGFLIAAVILWATRYGVRAVRRLVGSAANRWIPSPSLQMLLVQIGQVGAWVVGILAASVVAFPDLRLGDLIGLLGLGSVAIGGIAGQQHLEPALPQQHRIGVGIGILKPGL
ncbi:hypothetical protein [Synechococcus sp. H55.10]|uniref:hypothetical protein n=1 Tax=Synechococcus sp. H55.10 TaxID=2964503 RepID=UPI0039C6CE23